MPDTFNVQLPDGRLLQGIPIGTTKEQIAAKAGISFGGQELPVDNGPHVKPDASEPGFLPALERGASGAIIGTAQLLKNMGADKALSLIGRQLPDKDILALAAQSNEERGKDTGLTGLAGEILGDPISYLPVGKAVKGAGVLKSGAAKAVQQGAIQGLIRPESNPDSDITDNLQNAAIGGVAGLGGQVVGKGIERIAQPVGSQISANAGKLIEYLEANGVPLTAAQKTGSKFLSGLESVFEKLPFTSGAQRDIVDAQGQKFTEAALKEAGVNAPYASREVIDQAKQQFGQEYKNLAQNNVMNVDNPLLQKVYDIWQKAQNGRLGTDATRLVQGIANDIFSSGGQLDGTIYHETRKLLTQKAQSTADNFEREAFKDLRNALDEAFDRSLAPQDRGALADLNGRYRAFKPVQQAMEASNTASVRDAVLSPVQYYNKVETGAPGSQLADAGRGILPTRIGDSGTAEREYIQKLLSSGGTVANVTGAALLGAGSATDNDNLKALGAAVLGPKAAQMVYNRPSVQRYLTKGLGEAAQKATRAATPIIQRAVSGAVNQREGQQNTPKVEQRATMQPMSQILTQPASTFSQKVGQLEASGNANAKNKASTAQGLGQFTDSTWTHLVRKYGKEAGLTMNGRRDPAQSARAIDLYSQDNAKQLAAKGIDPTEQDLYLAHFLGAGGATKVLKAPESAIGAQILPTAAGSNPDVFYDITRKNGKIVAARPRTVGELRQVIEKKWMGT